MLERSSGRALPVINRAVDLAPAVQACCGACRTCVTSNVFALGATALVGLAAAARRLVTRRQDSLTPGP
jgi:hypothetical protein